MKGTRGTIDPIAIGLLGVLGFGLFTQKGQDAIAKAVKGFGGVKPADPIAGAVALPARLATDGSILPPVTLTSPAVLTQVPAPTTSTTTTTTTPTLTGGAFSLTYDASYLNAFPNDLVARIAAGQTVPPLATVAVAAPVVVAAPAVQQTQTIPTGTIGAGGYTPSYRPPVAIAAPAVQQTQTIPTGTIGAGGYTPSYRPPVAIAAPVVMAAPVVVADPVVVFTPPQNQGADQYVDPNTGQPRGSARGGV